MLKKGLTLFEIIVSAIILALAVLGLVSVFSSSRIHVQYSKTRVLAATLANYFLNNLSMEVTQENWNNSSNMLYILPAANNTTLINQPVDLNYIPFNSSYTISRVNDTSGSDTDLKRVQLAVNWTLTY